MEEPVKNPDKTFFNLVEILESQFTLFELSIQENAADNLLHREVLDSGRGGIGQSPREPVHFIRQRRRCSLVCGLGPG